MPILNHFSSKKIDVKKTQTKPEKKKKKKKKKNNNNKGMTRNE